MKPTLQDALNHGAGLLRAGRADAARELADRLLQQFPELAAVRLFAADASAAAGDMEAAMASLDAIPAAAREYPLATVKKARCLFAVGRRADALRLAQAAGGAAAEPGLMRLLAGVLRDCQDVAGAHDCLSRALAAAPGDPGVLYDLALAEYHLNRPDDAEAHIAELLAAVPLHAPALHLRSALRTQTAERNHVDDLRRRIDGAGGDRRLIAAASYALAKELEDLGRYDESVAALRRGAEAFRATLNYDAAAELEAHEGIRAVCTREALQALAPGDPGDGPIFVVGMPRTGTTLVERMLSAHSRVVSIGEFTEFPRLYGLELQRALAAAPGATPAEASLGLDFAGLGRAYLDAARELAGASPVFVDKLPFNFLYCGYILAALPRARIVHLTRDPLDACYAVYKTLFFGAYGFSYDLDELGSYYVSYRRHMAHWHEVLPGRILDVSYEALVRDPEPELRRLLSWCELPWEPGVLSFHDQDAPAMTASAMQVRRPVNTASIGSWRRAEALFAPLAARFEAEGLR